MSLTKNKGYLIARRDYELFDEILTFISYGGKRFSVFANGVRKITSKNSRSLFFGNYLEIEFFQSRFLNKLSKLKKVTTLSNIGYELNYHDSLLLISEILFRISSFDQLDYEFYQNVVNYIILKYDTPLINIMIYNYFLQKFNIFRLVKKIHCPHLTFTKAVGFDWKAQQFVCECCLSQTTVLLDDSLINILLLIYNNALNDIDQLKNVEEITILEKILARIFQHYQRLIYEKR